MTVRGQLFVPAHPTGCALIFPHGGPSRQMLLGYHYYDTYTVLYEMNQYFASHGCVVLSVDYRGGIMYGNAWRTFPGRGGTQRGRVPGHPGRRRVPARAAGVDPAKVGIYGLSYGGYLTTLGVSRNSNIFHVAWEMAGNAGNAAVANLASWTAPTLIEQGDDDRNVDFSGNIRSCARSRRRSRRLEWRRTCSRTSSTRCTCASRTSSRPTTSAASGCSSTCSRDDDGPGDVGGTVPATLSLTLGGAAGFGTFTPGVRGTTARRRPRR